MNTAEENDVNKETIIKRLCKFLNFDLSIFKEDGLKEEIKELCVAKLCHIVGLTGKYNYKSNFFEFFSSIMGEALCEKLEIKMHIASDALRLFKYEGINLVKETKKYLDEECVEEAFLDAFNLLDRFKDLIEIK